MNDQHLKLIPLIFRDSQINLVKEVFTELYHQLTRKSLTHVRVWLVVNSQSLIPPEDRNPVLSVMKD